MIRFEDFLNESKINEMVKFENFLNESKNAPMLDAVDKFMNDQVDDGISYLKLLTQTSKVKIGLPTQKIITAKLDQAVANFKKELIDAVAIPPKQ